MEARSHRQNATPMEPRAGHAAYDASTGRVTLTCTTQMPHLMRTAIADVLGMPESDLRVIAPDVGGGFGQKMSLASEYVVLVWLARKLKSSVAWTEDRRENLIAAFHSRDQYLTLQGAFDKDAKLIALKTDIVANVGAYSCFPTTCGVEPLMAMAEMPGPYDFRALRRARARRHHQHLHHGALSRRIAADHHLHAGTADGQGGARIRPRPGRHSPPQPDRSSFLTSRPPDSPSTRPLIKRRWKWRSTAIDLPAFRARQREARAQGRYLGIGFATFSERTGYGSPAFAARGMEITPGWETVILTIDPSGFVEARIGASPHGQGLRTTLAQIIADEIGVPPQTIRVVHGDTDRAPYGWGTFASRSLVISGGASLIAAQKVRAKLIKIASHMLEAAAGDIVLEDGAARVAGTDRSVSIAKMAREAYTQTHRFKGEIEPGISETGSYDPPGTFSNACHVAMVEVDVETGRTTVERYLVAEDAGRIINPMIADGPSAWRHRARHRQRAARRNYLRRERRHSHGHARRLSAADRARNSADRAASQGNAEHGIDHQGQGPGRRRLHRRAGRGGECDQRCAFAVRRRDRRNPGNAAARARGAALRLPPPPTRSCAWRGGVGGGGPDLPSVQK